MKLLPRRLSGGEVEVGITQRDQFDSDDFPLADTLIRESHQNTLDGRSGTNHGAVVTRIAFVRAREGSAPYWEGLLGELRPHLEASRVAADDIDLSAPDLLLIEDFGTTGLLGAWDRKDRLNFSDFWRRFGVSNKSGSSAGRWGLGKLVFSSASRIGTFFGLTVREHDEPNGQRILMGQAVLNPHRIDGNEYAPHIFFGLPGADGIQLPAVESPVVTSFMREAGLKRKDEPGLSIAVVFPSERITPDELMRSILENYFFPLLTGQLRCDFNGQMVDESSFDELATRYPVGNVEPGMIGFIRDIKNQWDTPPSLVLAEKWDTNGISASLSEHEIDDARDTFGHGHLVAVRAPLVLTRKTGEVIDTWVDLYFQKRSELGVGKALCVRGSITIPGEAKAFRGPGAAAALIARDPGISGFLGDAENPSHTKWTATAEKLVKGWKLPVQRLRAVRKLMQQLYDVIGDIQLIEDENLLLDILSIPGPEASGGTRNRREKTSPPRPEVPPPVPRPYRIEPLEGGFEVRGNAGTDRSLPYTLSITLAYDVRRGNPFTKYRKLDFDLTRIPSAIEHWADGAELVRTDGNVFEIEVTRADFRFAASGFDPERDLKIQVTK